MLRGIKLQAHRGVSTECPENTMAAFYSAYLQGYDIIETDPAFTSDGQIVIMHDVTINRTGRNRDGSEIKDEVKISDITYDEALKYDFGVWFQNKFRGEKIPLLSDALKLSKEKNIPIKIDNKVAKFPDEMLEKLFLIVEESGAEVYFTCFDIEFAKKVLKRLPEAGIYYDGEVSEEILIKLSEITLPGKLTVWVPVKSKLTEWVKVGFADKMLCNMIKKYAKLGAWILSEYEEFESALEYGADIVETTGKIKPESKKKIRADMHNHTKNSHDSRCEPDDLAESQIAAGNTIFAVTDHFDVEYCDKVNYYETIGQSVSDAEYLSKKYSGKIEVLKGVEAGEMIWHPSEAQALLESFEFDVIIGSVHAVRFKDCHIPFSRFDFSQIDEKTLIGFMNTYFDDLEEMLEKCQFDILAHLASPLKYINGKGPYTLDSHVFEERIEKILEFIIRHGIILEVNTASLGTAHDSLYAEEWVLKKYYEMGGYLISLGSDSHMAQNAGREFDRAYEILKNIGFKNAFYVKERFAIQYTL